MTAKGPMKHSQCKCYYCMSGILRWLILRCCICLPRLPVFDFCFASSFCHCSSACKELLAWNSMANGCFATVLTYFLARICHGQKTFAVSITFMVQRWQRGDTHHLDPYAEAVRYVCNAGYVPASHLHRVHALVQVAAVLTTLPAAEKSRPSSTALHVFVCLCFTA